MTYTTLLINGRAVVVDMDSHGNVITAPPALPAGGGGPLDYPPGLGPGIGLVQGMTDGSEVVRPLAMFNNPQGFTDDAGIINDSLARTGGRTRLIGGFPYTFRSPVIGHEGQYIMPAGIDQTVIKLAAGGFPAFQWTTANPSVFVSTGTGGILEPGLTVIGPGGPAGVNPTDGSIAAQMADIPKLRCKIRAINCQFGLLASNQNFFTEQAVFEVWSQSCTNPVVLQAAASGGAQRTGSFDRTRLTVYHNDFLNGGFGLGGVQLLAGAQLVGGKIRQYGNFNSPNGGGQSGTYGLYIDGSGPGTGPSSLVGVELIHGLESSASAGLLPGTIHIGAGNLVQAGFGGLTYFDFGPSDIHGTWQFSGPVNGDTTLSVNGWTTVSSGFPAGWSGSISYRLSDNLDTVELNLQLNITAGTAITQGEQFFSLPTGFRPVANKNGSAGFGAGGPTTQQPFTVFTNGGIQWTGAAITPGAGAFFAGPFSYPLFI